MYLQNCETYSQSRAVTSETITFPWWHCRRHAYRLLRISNSRREAIMELFRLSFSDMCCDEFVNKWNYLTGYPAWWLVCLLEKKRSSISIFKSEIILEETLFEGNILLYIFLLFEIINLCTFLKYIRLKNSLHA